MKLTVLFSCLSIVIAHKSSHRKSSRPDNHDLDTIFKEMFAPIQSHKLKSKSPSRSHIKLPAPVKQRVYLDKDHKRGSKVGIQVSVSSSESNEKENRKGGEKKKNMFGKKKEAKKMQKRDREDTARQERRKPQNIKLKVNGKKRQCRWELVCRTISSDSSDKSSSSSSSSSCERGHGKCRTEKKRGNRRDRESRRVAPKHRRHQRERRHHHRH